MNALTARPRWRRPTALAAGLYLAVALFALRAVLPHPRTTLPYPATLARLQNFWLDLSLNDQLLTTSLAARHARQLVTAPWAVFDNAQCYPTPNATALGEHMLGIGLLSIVPYALTHDPVLTMNTVLVLRLWLAGMSMFALVAHWTRSPVAALVAGLLFTIQPSRLSNLIHPYVEGNEWTVVALLAAHLLFTRRSWSTAALLAAALCLQLLESFYAVLALAVVGGTYGLGLAIRYHRMLPALAPKLAAVIGVVVLAAAAIFTPYLQMRSQLGGLEGRTPILASWQDFAYGGRAYPGTVTVALAAIALGDRLRRRRTEHGYDPRLVYLGAGLLAAAVSMDRMPLPFGLTAPSLYRLAAHALPGLDAIRVPAVISRGAALAATFLAGYGVLAAIEHRRPSSQALIGAALGAAALAEVFIPALATRGFGAAVTMAAHDVRPPPELLALYDRLPDGPILDVPFNFEGRTVLQQMPHYVFLAAYHRRPVAACYNSFLIEVQRDVAALASRVPERDAMDALAALGFRSLVVHDEIVANGGNRRLMQLTAGAAALHPPDPASTRLTLVGSAASHTAYVLAPPAGMTTAYDALAASAPTTVPGMPPTAIVARPPSIDLNVVFRNGSGETYRHPLPIAPTPLLVRWYSDSGELRREEHLIRLLPLALAAGQSTLRKVTIAVDVGPGEYQVSLAPAATPDLVLSRQRLRVLPDDPHGS